MANKFILRDINGVCYVRPKSHLKSTKQIQERLERERALGMSENMINITKRLITLELVCEVTLNPEVGIATDVKTGEEWEYNLFEQGMAFKQS